MSDIWLTLDGLLARVAGRPDPARLMKDFVPPPRFAGKDFDSYHPAHATQEQGLVRATELASQLGASPVVSPFARLLGRSGRRRSGQGLYIDGGFGVGKTHILTAIWNRSASPKFYLSFDELMYFVGLLGSQAAARAFSGARLIAVDEWELDDPGNLKLAIAFLREAIRDGAFLAVTSNTIPLELGSGRFTQKDFAAEVEELAAAFEVIRIGGEDYRRRQSAARPRKIATRTSDGFGGTAMLHTTFPDLISALNQVHPSRYRELVRPVESLLIDRIDTLPSLADALRFVHFVDALYVSGREVRTLEDVRPDSVFTADAVAGPFGKKVLRCISRLHELLGEATLELESTGTG